MFIQGPTFIFWQISRPYVYSLPTSIPDSRVCTITSRQKLGGCRHMGHTVIISNNFGIDTAEAQSDKSGSYINNTKIF